MKNDKELILVIEDEDIARRNLTHILEKMGYSVVAVDSGVRGLELLKNGEFDLVITDLKMEKVDGLQILRYSREHHPYTEVIVITGYATVNSAVEAMKLGAYHYIAKPYKLDEVRKLVKEALLKRRIILENINLKSSLGIDPEVPFIIGKSPEIQKVKKTILQIAPTDSNVVIFGESGTGKELVARAIHQLSGRAGQNFVAFNCGSFTEELMANELFGHEKGAFTGATSLKPGLLEMANKGTIFLDEIGDMPLSMQVKLLRVIQEKEFFRVGGVTPIQVDVRYIAATHRDLKKDIDEGHFRQDLYYRLNVISIKLPPLSERKEDIPLLARHFLTLKSSSMKKKIDDIDDRAMDLLKHYIWPGNVRELENVIERAVALENSNIIQVSALPEYIQNLNFQVIHYQNSEIPSMEDQEKFYIRWVLKKCGYNKSKAASIMKIDRVTLWRKLKKYGLDKELP